MFKRSRNGDNLFQIEKNEVMNKRTSEVLSKWKKSVKFLRENLKVNILKVKRI